MEKKINKKQAEKLIALELYKIMGGHPMSMYISITMAKRLLKKIDKKIKEANKCTTKKKKIEKKI